MKLRLIQATTVVVGVFFSAALLGCKDDSSAVPVVPVVPVVPKVPVVPEVPAKIVSLTAHPWFLVGVTTTALDGSTVDSFRSMSNCLKDNTLLFKSSQYFTYDPGTIRCNVAVPRELSWSFQDNESKLLLPELPDFINSQVQLAIVTLTATTLQLKYLNTVYTYADKGDFAPPSPKIQAVFNILTSHKWRLSVSTVYGNTVGGGSTWVLTDLYARMPACRRDDFLQFTPDFRVVNDEGISRCTSTDPQSKTTQWSLGDDGELRISGMYATLGVPEIVPGYPGGISVTDSTLSIFTSRYSQGNGYNTTDKYTAF